MSNFVTLSKEEFEALLPEGFKKVSVQHVKELVYDISTEKENLSLRIYSTIDSFGFTRDKGSDAIRIIHWDNLNSRPLGKGAKILRVEGATTVGDRIKQRISEMMEKCKDIEIKPLPKKNIWPTVDPSYVKAILESPVLGKNGFAKSLLGALEQYGSLTDGQLAYVLGELNPKGRPTFESDVKAFDTEFSTRYFALSDVQKESPQVDLPAGFEGIGYTNKREREYIRLEPIDEKDVTLIPTKKYKPWKYPFKEFNPVQSLCYPHREKDINVVVGANTSAGKTICSELFMDHTLSQDQRVIYLSPLKSLTQEKYTDWQERFPDKEITILTGDYTLSETMKKKLAKSAIIVMTSEMADSRSRKMHSENNFWLKEVGLVIVDESHILSTERGHAVETGLMRFTKINPKARIVLLSATMPNVGELGQWLTKLNGKHSEIIYCNWRPVVLDINYNEYIPVVGPRGRQDYKRTQDLKIEMAINKAMEKTDEKYLIFVHDKNTGRRIAKILREQGEDAMFHNADLDLEERKEVEDSFRDRDGGIRCLVSTSTLAWGAINEKSFITMPNGSKWKAYQFSIGDDILSFNEITGELEQDTILNISPYHPIESIEIELENGEIVFVDRKHPFYVKTKEGIIQKEAEFLTENDELILEEEFY